MQIERPGLGVCVFLSVVVVTDFPDTLFQDRHRGPQAVGQPEKLLIFKMYYVRFILVKKLSTYIVGQKDTSA